MRRSKVVAGVTAAVALAAGALAAGCAPARESRAARSGFAIQSLWDDGRAEFSTYTAATERYGQARPATARIIVVKEDLLRASLEVLKESVSHTEDCGITFVRVGPRQGRPVHETHSYWEGEADRELPLTWPAGDRPRVWWDALPVWLHAWADERTPREWPVWLLPGQISGRSQDENARPVDARIRRSDGGALEVPAGRFESVKFAVARAGQTDLFWFDARPPHVLLRMETAAGRKLALRRTQRLDDWNHRAVGDERLVD